MSVLRYGQETTTMMSAYAAVFLSRLLRNTNTLHQLHEGAADEAYTVILHTAEAYHEASVLSSTSSAAAYHARFLKGLLDNEVFRYRKSEKPRRDGGVLPDNSQGSPPVDALIYEHQVPQFTSGQYPASSQIPLLLHSHVPRDDSPCSGTLSPSTLPSVPAPIGQPQGHMPPAPMHYSEPDQIYWRRVMVELGFEGGGGMGMNTGETYTSYPVAASSNFSY